MPPPPEIGFRRANQKPFASLDQPTPQDFAVRKTAAKRYARFAFLSVGLRLQLLRAKRGVPSVSDDQGIKYIPD